MLTKLIDMKTTNYTIRIENEKFGKLLHETFVDAIQFKLFLKMVQGCLALKQDLTTYDAQELFIHIPFKVLVECVIVSGVKEPLMTLADYAKEKSKMVNQ